MRYYMFNKPRGYITACRDERQQTIMELIPESERENLYPIGRLDKDPEGFLILTDDGQFCYSVMNPNSNISKTYRFWARGSLDDEKIRRLESGVGIYNDPSIITAPARARKIGEAALRDIAELAGEDPIKMKLTKRGDVPVTQVEMTITEGKKHQVKRMAMAVGMRVVYLERIAIGGVSLDADLPRGEYRAMTDSEVSKILESKGITD